jgi:hypothetical protein
MVSVRSFRSSVFTGGIAALLLLFGCGGGGGSSSTGSSGSPGANASVNLAITDAPSDNWQEVSVVLESASLIAQGSQTPTRIWPPAGSAGTTPTLVNLVDLANVATVIGSVPVPAGTYSTLQLVVNTDPGTMTLVDDGGNTIPSSAITVRGSGTLDVALAPAFVVPATGTTTLQADFNLADPLSISETTLGGATQVVLDLQVRFKALPAHPGDQQFTRKLGQVTATTASGFTLTDSSKNTFTYGVDADTIYWDADTKAAGAATGVVDGVYALVDANLDSGGSLYARRVWYAAAAATLPACTPEGLVRRVNPGNDTFTICSQAAPAAGGTSAAAPAWSLQTVTVNASTVWTFKTSVAMGTGTGFLADIWRGCRVDVVLDSTGTTASAVNVESAYDEGFLGGASATGITFGWSGLNPLPTPGISFGLGDLASRTWAYYQNAADPTNAFSWWYFGLPSSPDTAPADLVTVFNAVQTTHLPAAAYANLYWDVTSGTWQVYQLILEPEPLNTSVITTAYTDAMNGSGSMGVTCLNPFNAFDATAPTPLTITLDYTGDLQTVVESTTWNGTNNTFTFVDPVPPADWATLLVPPSAPVMSAVQTWVRPVISGSSVAWHAYNVAMFANVVPARPSIASFTADPTTVASGGSSSLTAVFSNGTGVVNPGSLAVTSGTPVTVSPTATTTYVLTVTGSNGQVVTRSATVAVGSATAAPVIAAFTAIPPAVPAGASAALVGVFANGSGVITPGNLPATSRIPVQVTPTATTTYTLTVTGAGGAMVTRTATVTVQPAAPAPTLTRFAADPTTIAAGQTATLTGVFANGMGVITPGFLLLPSSGQSVTVKPQATTTYTLTVVNPAGVQVAQTAVVTVTPAS